MWLLIISTYPSLISISLSLPSFSPSLLLPLFSRYVQSWIDKREVQSEKANLTILFDRYIPTLLDIHRTNRFKMITPIQEVSMIQTLCYLLETQLTPENTPPDTSKEIYELFFVFCAIWAFGGFLFQDQVSNPYHSKCLKIGLSFLYIHVAGGLQSGVFKVVDHRVQTHQISLSWNCL